MTEPWWPPTPPDAQVPLDHAYAVRVESLRDLIESYDREVDYSIEYVTERTGALDRWRVCGANTGPVIVADMVHDGGRRHSQGRRH